MNQWGPALLIVFSILVGVIYSNKRLDDLRSQILGKIGDLRSEMDARFGDLRSEMVGRLDDLRDGLRAEMNAGFKRLEERIERLEERIERLEHPVRAH